jgi:hypothetical protein
VSRASDGLRFTLRFDDDDLREEVMAAARRQMRSLNREIQYRLRKSFERTDEAPRDCNSKSENKKMPATKAGKLERSDDGRRTHSRSRAQ